MIEEQVQSMTVAGTPATFKLHGGDCMVMLDGGYTGLTVTLKVSNDGGATYRPVAATAIADGSLQTGTITIADNSSVAFKVNTAGWPLLQVNPVTLSTGAVDTAIDQTGIVFQQPLVVSSLTGNQAFNNIVFNGTETTPPGASTVALG